MGEVIRILKKICLEARGRWEFSIELNHPLGSGGKRVIHIQTDRGRIELAEETFVHLVGTVLDAEEKLRVIKDLRSDEPQV